VDADELGWAETYDAEYIALAQVQKSTLVILDKKLARRSRSPCRRRLSKH
jgi:predicted nucleic acid-binding protein